MILLLLDIYLCYFKIFPFLREVNIFPYDSLIFLFTNVLRLSAFNVCKKTTSFLSEKRVENRHLFSECKLSRIFFLLVKRNLFKFTEIQIRWATKFFWTTQWYIVLEIWQWLSMKVTKIHSVLCKNAALAVIKRFVKIEKSYYFK